MEGVDLWKAQANCRLRLSVPTEAERSTIVLAIKKIFFKPGKDRIQPSSVFTVKEISNLLEENPGSKMEILGSLSKERATTLILRLKAEGCETKDLKLPTKDPKTNNDFIQIRITKS